MIGKSDLTQTCRTVLLVKLGLASVLIVRHEAQGLVSKLDLNGWSTGADRTVDGLPPCLI